MPEETKQLTEQETKTVQNPLILKDGSAPHLFLKEEQVKGGKANTSEEQAWKRIKKCTDRCPFYESCSWITVSHGEKCNGLCAVKKMPLNLQRSFQRVLSGKESEFKKELESLFVDFMTGTEEKPSQKDKILIGMKLKDALFGKEVRNEMLGGLNLNQKVTTHAEDVNLAYEEHKKKAAESVKKNEPNTDTGNK